MHLIKNNKLMAAFILFVIITSSAVIVKKKIINQQWKTIVESDGKGYYAYLPAIFIYNDLDFSFIEHYENQYYNKGNFVDFRSHTPHGIVNKYWIGESVLMLPFFTIGHIIANVFDYATDGYSKPYQVMVSVAAIFYLLLALILLHTLLTKFYQISNWISVLCLVVIYYGTNLFYYAVAEPSMSHVYSFFAITCFYFFAKKFFIQNKTKDVFIAALSLGIVTLIRPSNLMVLATIPFIAGSFQVLKNGAKTIIKNHLILSLVTFSFLIFPLLQGFFYYHNTGSFFVYSYSNEGFNFTNPELFNFLFSYRKGWFTYTPISLLAIIGIIVSIKKHKFEMLSLLVFLFIVLFILSSWWMWYYGGSFGMRPMIDFYSLLVLPMAYFIDCMSRTKLLKSIAYAAISFFIILNITQTYQRINFILPWDGMTKEKYWQIFMKTDKKYIGLLK